MGPRAPQPWRSSGQQGGDSGPQISWPPVPPALPSAPCPRWGGPYRGPPLARGLLPSPHLSPPTSRVLGLPLTSRQRTGISMLLVPGDRAPVRSPQEPGASGEPGALSVGGAPRPQTINPPHFWANAGQEAFPSEVLAPGCKPGTAYHRLCHSGTKTPTPHPPSHVAVLVAT